MLAAETAYDVTARRALSCVPMERAYGWFLGRNDLGIEIADPARGAGATD